MSTRISKLPNTIDLPRLLIESLQLISIFPVGQLAFSRQISLQTNGSDDWAASIGSRPRQDEGQWNQLHPKLVGTWWEDFFKSLPMPVFRTRIMIMPPRVCYSLHRDANPRLHIAVKTDYQSRFIFIQPPEIIHIPSDSHIWMVDTREEHTAINGSLMDRIHIVMCLVNTDIDGWM